MKSPQTKAGSLRVGDRQARDTVAFIQTCLYLSREWKLARRIAISDEVYELLKRSKLPGEGFSTVIKRNLQRGKLSEISGTPVLSKDDWAATRKVIAEAEALTAAKLARQARRPGAKRPR
jgi:predicted CopG family antitoxin